MILKAKYDNEEPCYINTDFIVDVFEKNGTYTLYTLDNDRMGYVISKEDFEKWIAFVNSDTQKVKVVNE